jgi:cytochrome c-type biogenesis protein CcmH/NrfG
MNAQDVLWFSAGVLSAIAAMSGVYLWLRGRPLAPWLPAAPKWAFKCAALILVVAVGLYFWLGGAQRATSPGVANTSAGVIPSHAHGSSQSAGSMDKAVMALESRLARSGGSEADWHLLSKSYEFMGRSDDAAAAHEKRLPQGAGAPTSVELGDAIALLAPRSPSAAAHKLIVNADTARIKNDLAAASADYRQLVDMHEMTADTWADFADVTASLNGNSLVGAPEKYLQAALNLDPQHAKALWLLASLEHSTGQYTQAVSTWKKLTATLGSDSPNANLVAANLAEDQQLADSQAPEPKMALTSGVAVRGEIVLSDALRAKVPAGLTLYILAKSVDSPGAPVAVLRTTTGSWPVKFELNDTFAMFPERKLSTVGKVTVEARISKSGQATPKTGDLQGVTEPLNAADAKPVRIVIERVIG